jgi:hypothetical protein
VEAAHLSNTLSRPPLPALRRPVEEHVRYDRSFDLESPRLGARRHDLNQQGTCITAVLSEPDARKSRVGAALAAVRLSLDQAALITGPIVGKNDRRIRPMEATVLSWIIQPPQHIANNVESRMFLVTGPDQGPGRGDGVCPLQHLVPRFGIGLPIPLRLGIDGAQLPLLQGIPWRSASRRFCSCFEISR